MYDFCMSPYPIELRERVVAAVNQGEHTNQEVATIFNVGISFVKKMLKLAREGADLAPRHGGGAEAILKEKERSFLQEQVRRTPDATLEELQSALFEQAGVRASIPTLCRALQQLHLPRKKKASNTKSATRRRGRSSGN
jgi:transposase